MQFSTILSAIALVAVAAAHPAPPACQPATQTNTIDCSNTLTPTHATCVMQANDGKTFFAIDMALCLLNGAAAKQMCCNGGNNSGLIVVSADCVSPMVL